MQLLVLDVYTAAADKYFDRFYRFIPAKMAATPFRGLAAPHILPPEVWKIMKKLLLLAILCFATGCPSSEKPATPPSQSAVQLPSDAELKSRLDAVINFARDGRRLNSRDHAAWQVVHGALEFGRDFQIEHEGKLVGALDHVMSGGKLKGWDMRKGSKGVIAIMEAGSKTGQGHPDQWLGYLSQCGLMPTDKLVVGGEEFTVNDLITQAQWDIYDGMEATWTLMAFGTFLPIDATWKAKDGQEWSVERMVEMENDADHTTRACGGTHCLYGLAVALNKYKQEGGDLNQEPWKSVNERIYGYEDPETKKHVDGLIDKARKFQQPDGSLSVQFFERPGSTPELANRIHATGHTFEFLCAVLTDDQLKEPWVTRAAVSLIDMLERTQDYDVECGALYHAVHGLDMYRTRRFGAPEKAVTAEPAKVTAAAEDKANEATEAPQDQPATEPADTAEPATTPDSTKN